MGQKNIPELIQAHCVKSIREIFLDTTHNFNYIFGDVHVVEQKQLQGKPGHCLSIPAVVCFPANSDISGFHDCCFCWGLVKLGPANHSGH